ncbi:uncharacterized [Tachysurus ichikawai]
MVWSLETSLSPPQPFLTALLITLSPALQKHSSDLGSLGEFCTSLRGKNWTNGTWLEEDWEEEEEEEEEEVGHQSLMYRGSTGGRREALWASESAWLALCLNHIFLGVLLSLQTLQWKTDTYFFTVFRPQGPS